MSEAHDAAPGHEPWRDMVRRLRESDRIDEGQETVLIRYFGDRESELALRMERISAEYREREARDGEQAAIAWLKQVAEQMGREDREDARRMLASIGVEA